MNGTRLTLPEVLGPLTTLNERLAGENGREWLQWLNKFNRKENSWGVGKLLEFLVTVPATKKKFIVKKKFVVDTSNKAKVKIYYLGDNFKKWFLSKTEEPIRKIELRYSRLKERSVDEPIIKELGGEVKAETTLTEIFSLMEMQKNGEDGALLNNGYTNIFYVRDSTHVLRTVYVRWDGDGWDVHADTVEDPDRLYVGHQLFSRNS